ncbi:hypothetical protein [Dickeya fangzhongdai]|uniref:hypothetical protein n=1 Tax=Dickeya fangzhongdai TaxID=1778540 RepID=UPI0023E43A63|nr:hypothetical protein [Dickeya fangzhongdai]WES88818.1 hypothetical protein PQ617_21865 [Dickeya fangzhongdai]
MLKWTHHPHKPTYLTLPDGRVGRIITHRRADVFYDLPADVRISNDPPENEKLIIDNQK